MPTLSLLEKEERLMPRFNNAIMGHGIYDKFSLLLFSYMPEIFLG